MKKLTVMLLIGALSCGILAGCGKKDVEPEQIPLSIEEGGIEELEIEVDETHEGQLRSDLTGEWIDEELAMQRPFAIMMGNTKIATPHYGITSADVVYEAPVEGSETRLMSIFQDYKNVEKIMSIRSCRLYYIDWALEFDAIYGHFGQAYLAEDMLSKSYVNNLSGLDGSLSKMYFRDSSRKAPHNAYTTGEGIIAGIETKGYETQHAEDYESHYNFNTNDEEEIQLDGSETAVFKPGYFRNKPWFVYDSESGLYKRYQFDSAHTDGNNNEQVAVKNILVQIVDWNVADTEKGYLAVNTTSGGDGYYITNGKAVPVKWSKASQTAPTKYFDQNGDEIIMNQGKTWVCIVQNTYADEMAFYSSEEEFHAAK